MNLTQEQINIMNLCQGQHLVLAPPGTGKTELLAQRLSNALKNGMSPNDMICLTFTNRAAKNMLSRIEKEVGEHEIFIGNIHSYCNIFLRKNKIIPMNSSLLDEEDTELIFTELKKEFPGHNIGTYKTGELLRLSTLLKQKKMNFPQDVLQKLGLQFSNLKSIKNAIKLCRQYEAIKSESIFIDFDDLLTLTYEFLSKQGQANQHMIKWLQVDEVQDLNPLQWAIINKISNKQTSHRVFFGDYEQAIFSFMGSKIEVLDGIAKESTVHELYNNFRSPPYLLQLYNAYAKHWLSPRWKKEPTSLNVFERPKNALAYKEIKIPHEKEITNKWNDTVRYQVDYYSTDQEEVEWIVKNKLPKEPAENTAILVRTNSTADKFASEFNDVGVSYFKISGFDLFRRKIIKDLMAFLNVIVDDHDRNSWIRNLHLYGKIESLKESRRFINKMFENGIKPLDLIKNQTDGKTFLDGFLNEFQNKRMVIFDTETTGLDTHNDDIIQIAAIEIINGTCGKIFEVYINTDKDLTESEKIHKITKDYLNAHSVDKTQALKSFLNFIGDATLVAHNITYDLNILNSNLLKCGLESLSKKTKLYDTIEVARRLHPKSPSYKLEYLLKKLDIEGKNSHNALDDVKATANLILSFELLIQNSHAKRVAFLQENKKILDNFTDRFMPIYTEIANCFNDYLPMNEVVDMIVTYMIDQLQCKAEDNIFDEIQKLTKHMEFQCQLDKVLVSINQHIPEYNKYKEADLVLENEKLVIATIHKAKGLEFENVIIPECTDDSYPSFFSKQDGADSIIEDARLLYVAMTRAKKRLLLTSHTLKIIHTERGRWEIAQKPSRFLAPILSLLNHEI